MASFLPISAIASRRSSGSGRRRTGLVGQLDFGGAVAAGRVHEFLDHPAGLGFVVVADGQRGDHDA